MPNMEKTLAVFPDLSLNALSLEYKRDYGTASGDLNILDLINNPAASGKCCVFGLHFQKELSNVVVPDLRSFFDDGADSFMVTCNPVQPLP